MIGNDPNWVKGQMSEIVFNGFFPAEVYVMGVTGIQIRIKD